MVTFIMVRKGDENMFGIISAFLVAPAFYNKYKNEPGVKRVVHLSQSFSRSRKVVPSFDGEMNRKIIEYRKKKGWD